MIIAIHSNHNSVGKSTVAKMIFAFLSAQEQDIELTCEEVVSCYDNEDFLYNWSLESFSSYPNEAYFNISGIDFQVLPREDKEKERPRFIEFCEQCKNIFGNDIWVKNLFESYTKDTNWIISDLRFQVELDRIKQEQHFIIGITKHKDEDPKFKCDAIIVNDGALLDLCRNVKEILIWKELI